VLPRESPPSLQVAVVAAGGRGEKAPPPSFPPSSGTLFKGNKIDIWKKRNDRWHDAGVDGI